MNYLHLNKNDFDGLTRERIIVLEGEHYRLALLLRETLDPDTASQLVTQQNDIERRIALHLERPEVEAAELEGTAERK
jgi:inactivated superfamily I helicase